MVDSTQHSDEVVLASGDSSVEPVIESRTGYPLTVDTVRVDYDGSAATAATTVELHEAPDDATSGDLDASTRRLTLFLGAGDTRVETGLSMRELQEDLVVLPDGNQDADLAVYAGGYHIETTR